MSRRPLGACFFGAASFLIATGAGASATGAAVPGTMLDDPASAFEVQVTAASGLSFGTITLDDNALSLTPTNFSAGPLTGPVSGSLQGSITLLLTPDRASTAITALNLQELGDYWLAALSASSSQLGVNFALSAGGAAPGAPISQLIKDTGALAPTGLFSFAPWSLSGSLGSGSMGGWQALPGGGVELTLTNNIYYDLASGESGFLEKKDAGVALEVMTSTVALPGAIWLFLPALSIFGFFGKGRRLNASLSR